jgi:hypothetical protein
LFHIEFLKAIEFHLSSFRVSVKVDASPDSPLPAGESFVSKDNMTLSS